MGKEKRPKQIDALRIDDAIQRRIHIIRGERVMLDADLAALYEVETKRLNQAIRRNRARFPADFMFQLNAQETHNLRSHLRPQVRTATGAVAICRTRSRSRAWPCSRASSIARAPSQ